MESKGLVGRANVLVVDDKPLPEHILRMKIAIYSSYRLKRDLLKQRERQIVGAVVLLQDITETRKIEEALEERVTKLIAPGVQLEKRAVH